MKQVTFLHNGERITEGIELRNGKSNPFGWSTHEVWLVKDAPYPGAKDEERIGRLYCGIPEAMKEGYSFVVEDGE